MRPTADRKSGWIAVLSMAAGAAVMVPALAALAVNIAAVLIALI